MKEYLVEITGAAPLLQHRFNTEDHGENKSRASKKVYDPKVEAESCLYRDEEGFIYIPSEHIFASMVRGATGLIFSGKKTYKDSVKGGIVIVPDAITLGRKDYDEIDTRAVVVQRSRIIRWRPKFNKWSAEFTVRVLDDQNIGASELKDILERAGNYGVGDYRPRFGRFIVTKFKEGK